jgi:hypothetical protein
VVSSISVSGTHTVTAQTPDGPDAVEAHYQPQIAAFGEVQRADFASGDGGMRSLSATGSDGRTASLVIMTSPGEPTTINVSVTTP